MKIQLIITESVSISPDINEESDDFKDVLSITNFCSKVYFHKILPKYAFFNKYVNDGYKSGKIKHISFDPDGDSAFEKTGVINFYVNGMVTDHFFKDFKSTLNDLVVELNKYVKTGGIAFEGKKESYDTPRAKYAEGDSASNIFVIRIPVLENEVAVDQRPEMNISNANARNLFKLLGLNDEDLIGTISHKDIPRMLLRIKNYSDQKLSTATREPETSEPGKARVIDSGVDIQRVKSYLDRLEDILVYAKDKGVDVVYS